MENKIILVTGGTSGIGKAACAEFVKTGATVVLVARNEKKLRATIEFLKNVNPEANIDYVLGDLSSLKSVRQIAEEFKKKYKTLDILVNDAGLLMSERNLTVDGYEMTFAVNHLSHFLLTNLLLDCLKTSPKAKIVNTTSSAQDNTRIYFDDIFFEKKYSKTSAYCQSKLANVIFTVELANRLKKTNITVNAFHPGYVKTEFPRDLKGFLLLFSKTISFLAKTPEKGAETLVWLALSNEAEEFSGKLFFNKKLKKVNPIANDPETRKRFWELSEQLTNCKY